MQTAIDELISPLTNDQFISTWQQELLVHTLLVEKQPRLALRALRAPGPPIGTVLEVKTLLANDLITEAFELQRTKYDDNLLLEFYKGCHHHKKWNYVLGLALTEREGQVLLKFLRSNETLLSENLQLLYLLQRNKYIEALTYLDGMKYRQRTSAYQRQLDDTQGTIFSAFKMGMVPSDRKLSDLFMTVKDHIGPKKARPMSGGAVKEDKTKPFSSDLNTGKVDGNANIIGDLFQRAIISAKNTSASIAAGARNDVADDGTQGYVPFLSKPSIDYDYFECNSNKPVTYPTAYVGTTKRRKEIAFEGNRDADNIQPAAKRARTTEPSALLLRSVACGLVDESHDGEIELNETVNLLSTPVVKSSRMEVNVTNQSSRCQTPQSILKHRHAESVASRRSVSPTLTVNSARRSVDFDERSFRFGTTANSSAEEYRLSAIPESNDTEIDYNSPYGEIKARMPLHAVDSSAQSMSADEFYSPENTKLSDRSHEIEEEQPAGEEIRRDFEEMSDYSVDSEKAKAVESKPAEEKVAKRSVSREPTTPQATTRMTRSRSKGNLDFDGVEGKPQLLETSTPLRTIRGRTPLSKAVIEINASKLLAERNKTVQEATSSTSMQQPASFDENESCTNILDDNSDMSESMMQQYLINKSEYSEASTAYTPNTRSRRNILDDSSQHIFDRSDVTTSSVEQQKDTSVPMETDETEPIVETVAVADTTDEKLNAEEQSDDKKLNENKPADESLLEQVEEVEEGIEINESVENVENAEHVGPTAPRIEPSTSHVVEESTVNILNENSALTESFVKRFTHTDNSTIYSETSTLFYSSTRATDLLEDSSFGPTLAPHSMKEVTEEPPIDLLQSQSSSEDNEEDQEEDKNEYASDVAELNYESNDSNDSNESKSSTSSSTSDPTTSSNGSSASSNRNDDDEVVINISSSSESSLPARSAKIDPHMEDENEMSAAAMDFVIPGPSLSTHAIYTLPGDDRPPSSNDYLITDMFSTPMDEMPDSSADLLPTQSLTDIVYGDLDDMGMHDEANDDEIYVAEAISVETQPQDNLLEPIESTTHTDGEAEAETVPETFSTDTLDRGFVDDGKESSDVSKIVEQPTDVEKIEVGTCESVATQSMATDETIETSVPEQTHVEEETNIFEKAIVVEQADSGVVDKTITDDTMGVASQSKTIDDELPSTSGVVAKKRRRSSSISSSSSQLVTETAKLPSKRSTRAKSVASDSKPVPTTPKSRPRRAVSQQSLTENPEPSPAEVKTRRQSSTLDTIAEVLKAPKTRRRKASETSDAELSSIKPAEEQQLLLKTPRRSLRSHGSDADSVNSTPSSRRQSVDRELSATPSTRSRRKIFTPQQETPSEPDTGVVRTPSRQTRSKRSATGDRDDDEVSEASSVASSARSMRSTRSTRSTLQTPVTEIDDDNVSQRSLRTTKRTRPASTLPAIDENAVTPVATTSDYLSASRVTRSQLATLQRHNLAERRTETPTTPKTPRTPRSSGRVSARRQSTMDSTPDADEDIADISDSKSIASDTSRVSRASKASRSSKRIRDKK